jgi:HK97 family phage portal protein
LFAAKLNGSSFETSRSEFEDLDPFARDGARRIVPMGGQKDILGEDGMPAAQTLSAWLMSLGGDRKITRPYLQNPWVYACIQAIARAVGSLTVTFVRGEGQDRKQVKAGPLSTLFDAPNPIQSQAKFLKQLVNYHELWGETYLLLLAPKEIEDPATKRKRTVLAEVPFMGGSLEKPKIGTPTEVWPIAGHLVQEVIDERRSSLPIAFRVQGKGGVKEYSAHAVVPISDANPYSVLRGVGPTTALLRDLAKAYQVDRYDDALLENGGSPGGVLSIEQALTEEDIKFIRELWQEAHGRPDKHRKTAVLSHGTKYEEHGFTPQEMEFAGMREWIRGTVMAVYGVTKPILGITDDVNRANSREAYRVFWEVTIMPLVRFFEDELNYRFMRRMADPSFVGMRIGLDTSNVEALQDDLDARVDRALKLYSTGHRTINEAAMLAGWDLGEQKLEGDDERWIPSNLIPADLAIDGPMALLPPADDDDEEEPPAAKPKPKKGGEVPCTSAADEQRAVERSTALDAYWKAHDAFLRVHEARFARATFGVFRRYLNAVSARLEQIAASPLAQAAGAPTSHNRFVATASELERLLGQDMDEWSERVVEATRKPYERAITSAARRLRAEVKRDASGVLLPTDPQVLAFLGTKQLKIYEGWLSNLAASLQQKLVQTLAEEASANLPSLASAVAETLEKLQSQVGFMQGQAGRRAMNIARTEITSSVSFARTEQMKREGIGEHSWLSSRDGTVRDHHKDLDGKKVHIGEVFGYGLRRPGDENAEAGEVVNCRCSTLPELPDERDVPDAIQPDAEDIFDEIETE